ncbi:MAG: heme NO-binding domain-containing protein [Myxococcota bacterium]
MLGVVFTEMVEMLEARFGPEEPERLLQAIAPTSGGNYTSLGYYPFEEMQRLLAVLVDRHGGSIEEWLREFGHHLLPRFAEGHPQFFADQPDLFSFLGGIETQIHARVRSLYEGAEVPRFEVRREGDTLTLRYQSQRGLAALARGLLEASAAYFQETISMEETDASGDRTDVVFVLRRRAA